MSAPDIEAADVDAVVEVLRSGRLALGPRTEAFESALADYVGTRHAVAVSSGTSALHLIVQTTRMVDGSRRISAITEVASMEGDMVALQDIYVFAQSGMTDDQKVLGTLQPTGIRPRFADRFERFGVSDVWVATPAGAATRVI